jgi:hypothetical protein
MLRETLTNSPVHNESLPLLSFGRDQLRPACEFAAIDFLRYSVVLQLTLLLHEHASHPLGSMVFMNEISEIPQRNHYQKSPASYLNQILTNVRILRTGEILEAPKHSMSRTTNNRKFLIRNLQARICLT